MVVTTAAAAAAPSQTNRAGTGKTAASSSTVPDHHPPVMVWVTQGKTDHAAFILKEQNGQILIKWAANEATQWVDANVEIKTELPKRRRGRRQAMEADYVFSSKAPSVSKPRKQTLNTGAASGATAATKDSKKRARPTSQGPKVKVLKRGGRAVKGIKYPKGTKVAKDFPPFGVFSGEVEAYLKGKLYKVLFEDNEYENLTEKQMDAIVVLPGDDEKSLLDNILSAEEGTTAVPDNFFNVVLEQTAGENTSSSSSGPSAIPTRLGTHSQSVGELQPALQPTSATPAADQPLIRMRQQAQIRPKQTWLPRRSSLAATKKSPSSAGTDAKALSPTPENTAGKRTQSASAVSGDTLRKPLGTHEQTIVPSMKIKASDGTGQATPSKQNNSQPENPPMKSKVSDGAASSSEKPKEQMSRPENASTNSKASDGAAPSPTTQMKQHIVQSENTSVKVVSSVPQMKKMSQPEIPATNNTGSDGAGKAMSTSTQTKNQIIQSGNTSAQAASSLTQLKSQRSPSENTAMDATEPLTSAPKDTTGINKPDSTAASTQPFIVEKEKAPPTESPPAESPTAPSAAFLVRDAKADAGSPKSAATVEAAKVDSETTARGTLSNKLKEAASTYGQEEKPVPLSAAQPEQTSELAVPKPVAEINVSPSPKNPVMEGGISILQRSGTSADCNQTSDAEDKEVACVEEALTSQSNPYQGDKPALQAPDADKNTAKTLTGETEKSSAQKSISANPSAISVFLVNTRTATITGDESQPRELGDDKTAKTAEGEVAKVAGEENFKEKETTTNKETKIKYPDTSDIDAALTPRAKNVTQDVVLPASIEIPSLSTLGPSADKEETTSCPIERKPPQEIMNQQIANRNSKKAHEDRRDKGDPQSQQLSDITSVNPSPCGVNEVRSTNKSEEKQSDDDVDSLISRESSEPSLVSLVAATSPQERNLGEVAAKVDTSAPLRTETPAIGEHASNSLVAAVQVDHQQQQLTSSQDRNTGEVAGMGEIIAPPMMETPATGEQASKSLKPAVDHPPHRSTGEVAENVELSAPTMLEETAIKIWKYVLQSPVAPATGEQDITTSAEPAVEHQQQKENHVSGGSDARSAKRDISGGEKKKRPAPEASDDESCSSSASRKAARLEEPQDDSGTDACPAAITVESVADSDDGSDSAEPNAGSKGADHDEKNSLIDAASADMTDLMGLAAAMVAMQFTKVPAESHERTNSTNILVATEAAVASDQQGPLPHEPASCPVCGVRIAELAKSHVDWTRPLHYPLGADAIHAINDHTAKYHSHVPVWNTLEATICVKLANAPPETVVTPKTYVRLALRHAMCCSYAIDESIRDMQKLRDLFVRRLGIARGFIEWSSDYFIQGRTLTNCSGETVIGIELRKSALLLLAYLEQHVIEEAFVKKYRVTEQLARISPLVQWRNRVQLVFLDPNGLENAWFMKDVKNSPYYS